MPKIPKAYGIALIIIILTLAAYFPVKSFLQSKFSRQHLLFLSQIEQQSTYDENDVDAEWWGTTAQSTYYPDKQYFANAKVLGTSGPKRIEVDLTNQRLYAFEGDNKIFDFAISSGLNDWTPRGTFNIWIKLKYTKMSGGNKALGTYYYLPNVPYTMYFSNAEIPAWRGFGLHGAYWHNDFGRPKSHGCVNLSPADAEKLFYWATPDLQGKNSIKATADNPGTQITIYGKYEKK